MLSFAQNTYYLEGKLGKSVIFMEISEYDNNYLEGNYFYEKSLKDIRLNGKFNAQSYNLYFGNDYEETEFEEKFELTKVNSDFIGQWKNKAGKNIAVTLKKIDFSKYKSKVILLVNVASKCGFTKQYADLQKLCFP